MEYLIVVIFIIASIYSEVNKKKNEDESIDIDDLMSLDNFTSSSSHKTSYVPPLPKPNKSRRKILKKKGRQPPSPSPKLEILEGLPAIDDAPETFGKNLEGSREKEMNWANVLKSNITPDTKLNMNMSQDEIVKAFVFSELMQRYNINRIYDRIPGINEENLEP